MKKTYVIWIRRKDKDLFLEALSKIDYPVMFSRNTVHEYLSWDITLEENELLILRLKVPFDYVLNVIKNGISLV